LEVSLQSAVASYVWASAAAGIQKATDVAAKRVAVLPLSSNHHEYGGQRAVF